MTQLVLCNYEYLKNLEEKLRKLSPDHYITDGTDIEKELNEIGTCVYARNKDGQLFIVGGMTYKGWTRAENGKVYMDDWEELTGNNDSNGIAW